MSLNKTIDKIKRTTNVEIKCYIKADFSNKKKKIALIDSNRLSIRNCLVVLTPNSMQVYQKNLFSYKLVDELLFSQIINVSEKTVGFTGKEITVESNDRRYKLTRTKSRNIDDFISGFRTLGNINTTNITLEKRNAQKSKHPAKLSFFKDNHIKEVDIVSDLTGNNGYLLVTKDKLFVSRTGASSGSVFSSTSKRVKKYPLDVITGMDVRKATFTAELEIITMGSIEISNSITNVFERSLSENIISFPLDEYNQISDFADAVMEQRKILMNTPTTQPTPTDSIPDQIKKLADLQSSGIISEAEFISKKTELLERM